MVKTGNKTRATCFATLLPDELGGKTRNIAIHVRTCLATKVVRFVFVGGKTRSIAIQLVLQQCCKARCALFVVPLDPNRPIYDHLSLTCLAYAVEQKDRFRNFFNSCSFFRLIYLFLPKKAYGWKKTRPFKSSLREHPVFSAQVWQSRKNRMLSQAT